MSQRNRMPVKMNEALASINTLFAYKIFFDCNQMKCLEISITNALQYLLKLIYSEKATKFCEISNNSLPYVLPVK